MSVAIMISEAAVLSSTLSMDAFIASFAYGSSRIRIPLSSVMVINFVCSGILGLSIFLGTLVRPYLSEGVSGAICFVILFLIGLAKLLDNITKSWIRKHNDLSKNIRFSLMNFKFILSIYADPEKSDADGSKSISLAEAVSLALALSLDGVAVGFGAVMGDVSGAAVFVSSLVTDAAAVLLGVHIGGRMAADLPFNISWISGIIFIAMAFAKLM